jgi:serine acetyltransferase
LGDEIVVAAMSLVNRDLPSGCLAGGIPVSILRENVYPREVSEEEKKVVLDQIVSEAQRYSLFVERNSAGTTLTLGKTVFDIPARKIEGPANEETERVKDLLRRHGIRFRFYHDGEIYRVWD